MLQDSHLRIIASAVMVKSKSPSRKLRSKRRLLLFLLRKADEGVKIKIDIFEMIRKLLIELSSNSKTDDFSESRRVSVIVTVNRTLPLMSSECRSMSNLVMEEMGHRSTLFKMKLLTSKPSFEIVEKFLKDINNLEHKSETRLIFKFCND